MGHARLFLPLLLTVVCLEGRAQGPEQQAFTCVANAGTPVIVRVEGITELVGDLLLQCTGGTPTPKGQPVPQSSIFLQLNTTVTSRLLNPVNGISEALLLIDEPGSAKNPAPQAVCGSSAAPSATSFICPVISTGTPGTNYAGDALHPNAFVSRVVGSSGVIWDGVPVDPPGSTGVRIIRMTNVRANASQLGLGSTLTPTQIVGFVSTAGGTNIAITNPRQTLAFIQQGLVVGTSGGHARKDCEDTNAGFLQGTIPNPMVTSNINIREGFAQSFKRSQFATTTSDPTASHAPTEAGLVNPNFPNDPVLGNLSKLGTASFGTRILLRFNNIGNGVRLFVPRIVRLTDPNGAPTGSMQLDFGGTAIPGITSYLFLNTTSGSGNAIYEVTSSDSNVMEKASIPVGMSYVGATVRGQIGQGTTTVTPGWTGGYLTLAGTSDLPPNVNGLLELQSKTAGLAPNGLLAPNANPAFTLFTVRGCPDQQPLLTSVLPPDFQTPVQFTAFSRPNGRDPIILPQLFNYGFSAPDVQIQNAESSVIAELQPRDAKTVTSNWLSLDQNEPNTPGTLTLSVNPKGLAAGNYNGSVTIKSAEASNTLSVPVRLTVASGPLITGFGVASAGSYVNNVVAPGEAVVIFGDNFGPASLAGAALGADGKITTNVGNTRVLFDGVAAPIYYSVAGQVAAFVPFGVSGKISTQVQVEYNGVKSPVVLVPVLDAVPSLFTADGSGGGQGAIFNQDQSFNSVTPEQPGNVIILYGTGAGQTDPAGRDGASAGVGGAIGKFLLPIKVFIDGQPATDIPYAGPAPSLVEGVFQINVRIPANARRNANLPVVVQVGDKYTQPGVTVAVR